MSKTNETTTGAGPTAGPWRAVAPTVERRKDVFASVRTNSDGAHGFPTCEFEIMADGYKNSEAAANARLIAEAGTVRHETGLTPRELADRLAAVCREAEQIKIEWKRFREEFLKSAEMIAAAPAMLAALKDARGMLETASRYFPKSIKNRDRFDLLNILNNSVEKAIRAAEGGAA